MIITVAVVLLVLAWVLRSALFPFAVALVIAYLLDPAILLCQRILRIKRLPALLLVFMLFLLFFFLLIISVFPPLIKGVSSLTETISSSRESINGFISGLITWFNDLPLPIDHEKIISSLYSEMEGFFGQLFSGISTFAVSAIGSAPLIIIIPLIVFYLLKDKVAIFASLKRFLREESASYVRAFFESINQRLGGYVRGQFLISMLVTVVTLIALLIFDIPYAILIAIANGILNIIPYFGPVIGAIPPVILALIRFSSLGNFIAVLVFFVVMNILVTTLASPKIFSKTTNLHPVIVLLALFIGSSVMGMLGMILAVPIAIIIQTLFRIVFDKYIWEL
jgi:predicted PurR-regulated permease PerM